MTLRSSFPGVAIALASLASACSLLAPSKDELFGPASNEAGASGAGTSGQGGSTGGSGGSAGSVTGGSAGHAATGGTGGTGGATCAAGTKPCGPSCVAVDDPAYGCTPTSCAPCNLPFATASCLAGACAIATCAADHDSCNGLADDGCETRVVYNGNACGSCTKECSFGTACENTTCVSSRCASSQGVLARTPPVSDVAPGVWAKEPNFGGWWDKLDEASQDGLQSFIWDDTVPSSDIWFSGGTHALPAGAQITSVKLDAYARIKQFSGEASLSFLVQHVASSGSWSSPAQTVATEVFEQYSSAVSTSISGASTSDVQVGLRSARSAQGNALEVTQLYFEYCVD